MTELLTAAQMRAIEQAAIDSGEVTGLELMERAGRGVVEAIFEEWPELAKTSSRAVILCGPGNNGGDGFVVARLLKDWGWEVEVFLFGEVANLPPDAKMNCERWLEMGEITANKTLSRDYIIENSDLIIDAIFGTGLNRNLEGKALTFCKALYAAGIDVAIDVPSGFCSDSGKFLISGGDLRDVPLGINLVVTFERAKPGLYLSLLPYQPEKLSIKTIGVGHRVPSYRRDTKVVGMSNSGGYIAASKDFFEELFGKENNKFHHGHALILSGPATKTGAARLAARGALRIGAGLVTIGSPMDALAEHAAQLNAIMLTGIDDAITLREVLKDERITSLCLGPGMGLTDVTRERVEIALTSGRKTVLDADALTVFQDNPQHLFDLLHENVVLTPHGGEFKRLFPDISARLNEIATIGPAYSKVDATRDAAARAGCVVLLKGADTVIANAQGRAAINSAHYKRAVPWLATAGAGDVLAGFIAGLLARGYPPMAAAESAAWLHVECALNFGPGLIAEDLPEQLPQVFRQLGVRQLGG